MNALSEDQLRSYLKIAEAAAFLAATKIKGRGSDLLTADFIGRRDIKLAADRAAEAVILDYLTAETGMPALSEEAGEVGGAPVNGLRWVVDPLDGTANYSRGIPLFCVSIALECEGEPVLGVIHDLSREETFSGTVGLGARLNGAPISVSRNADPARSIFATGLPARRDFSAESLGDFGRSLARWQKVRLLGSAALSLAYVAAGRCDAYAEQSIMPWDVAAGIALVRAAGGKAHVVKLESGGLNVIAGNVALLEAAF